MPLTIETILLYPSLTRAELITGKKHLANEVSGIMVMEALDVGLWGRKGLLLLTSYYAFIDKSEAEIDTFFQSAEKLGIAGIILKTDRLVQNIPAQFVSRCETHGLPLIYIDRYTSYEEVMNDILVYINNRDAYLLKEYYHIHQKFLQSMMNEKGILHTLESLKKLIDMPISLMENIEGKVIGTDQAFNQYQIEKSTKKQFSHDLNHMEYREYQLRYPSQSAPDSYTAVSSPIPNLGYEEYELLIHNGDRQVTDIDFVAIENAVIAIQTELVKQHALRQQKQSRLNEMASDLLHGRLTRQENLDETIQDLGLDPQGRYRVIMIHFENPSGERSQTLMTRYSDDLINHSRIKFPDRLYVTRHQRVILIVPAQRSNVRAVKQKVQTMLTALSKKTLYSGLKTQVSISNELSLHELPKGHKQVFDTLKFLRFVDDTHTIAAYQDTGIYQIFAETENIESMRRFIPENIWKLSQENLDLMNTLRVFIDKNQNYSETSNILFVHPKTVRYRVDKLKENYQIDFTNPEEILQYSIALRLLELITHRQQTEGNLLHT